MKKLFTLLFVSLSILTVTAQVKKKTVVKKPAKNQYYVVKEQIATLNTQIEKVDEELKKFEYLYSEEKFQYGMALEVGQSYYADKFRDSSDVVKQKYKDYYKASLAKIQVVQERKNILVNKVGQLEYKLATLPNPEGHWKTYYKGSRKLTVWVENGIEYQYPPKK